MKSYITVLKLTTALNSVPDDLVHLAALVATLFLANVFVAEVEEDPRLALLPVAHGRGLGAAQPQQPAAEGRRGAVHDGPEF